MTHSIFADFNPRHSDFQIDNFIVRKEGLTEWGQYQQAMRELHSRMHNMRENVIDALILARKIEIRPHDKDPLLDDLEKRKLEYELEASVDALKPIIEEMVRFAAIILSLRPKFSDMDDSQRKALDLHYWKTRISYLSAKAVYDTSRVGSEMLCVSKCLPGNAGSLAIEDALTTSNGDKFKPDELPDIDKFIPDAKRIVGNMVMKIDRHRSLPIYDKKLLHLEVA